MLRIKETIFDSHGAMRSRELLPVIFVDREPAIQFIHIGRQKTPTSVRALNRR
jgi:hypothetical protein